MKINIGKEPHPYRFVIRSEQKSTKHEVCHALQRKDHTFNCFYNSVLFIDQYVQYCTLLN